MSESRSCDTERNYPFDSGVCGLFIMVGRERESQGRFSVLSCRVCNFSSSVMHGNSQFTSTQHHMYQPSFGLPPCPVHNVSLARRSAETSRLHAPCYIGANGQFYLGPPLAGQRGRNLTALSRGVLSPHMPRLDLYVWIMDRPPDRLSPAESRVGTLVLTCVLCPKGLQGCVDS